MRDGRSGLDSRSLAPQPFSDLNCTKQRAGLLEAYSAQGRMHLPSRLVTNDMLVWLALLVCRRGIPQRPPAEQTDATGQLLPFRHPLLQPGHHPQPVVHRHVQAGLLGEGTEMLDAFLDGLSGCMWAEHEAAFAQVAQWHVIVIHSGDRAVRIE